MKFQIYGRRTALTSIQLTKKICGIVQQRVESAGCDWFDAASVWYYGVEQSVIDDATDSGAGVSMLAFEPQEDIGIFTVIQISQN